MTCCCRTILTCLAMAQSTAAAKTLLHYLYTNTNNTKPLHPAALNIHQGNCHTQHVTCLKLQRPQELFRHTNTPTQNPIYELSHKTGNRQAAHTPKPHAVRTLHKPAQGQHRSPQGGACPF